MAAALLPNGKQQFIDINGKPLVGGTVGMYIPGTLIPKNTWQDALQTILNTNPIVLDSRGQALIYGSGAYRQIVKDADGNLIWDELTAAGSGGAVGGISAFQSVAEIKALGTSAPSFPNVSADSYWGDKYGPTLFYAFEKPCPGVPDDGFFIVPTGLAADGSDGAYTYLPNTEKPLLDVWGVSPGQTKVVNSPRLQKAFDFIWSAYNISMATIPNFGTEVTFQYRKLGMLGGTYDCSNGVYDFTNKAGYPVFIPGLGIEGVATIGNIGASTLLVGSQTENYPGIDASGVGGLVFENVVIAMVSSGDQPAIICGNINNNDGTFTPNGNVTFLGGGAYCTNNSYSAVAIQDGDILVFDKRWTGGGGQHRGRSAVSTGKIWEEIYGPTVGTGTVGADAASGSLLTLGSGSSAVNGFYVGKQIIVMWNGSSTFADIDTYRITAYNGGTKVCTLDHALYHGVTMATSKVAIPKATSKYAYLTNSSNGATYIDLGNSSFQAPQAFVWNGGQICKGNGNYFASIGNANYDAGDMFTINPYFTNSTYNELDLKDLDFEEYVTDPSKPIAIVNNKAISTIKLSGNSRLHVTDAAHLRGVIESLSTNPLADVRNIELSGLLSGDDLTALTGGKLFNITQPNPVQKISGEIIADLLGVVSNAFCYWNLVFVNNPPLTQEVMSGQFCGASTLLPELTTFTTTGGSTQVRFSWAIAVNMFNPAFWTSGPLLCVQIALNNTGGSPDTVSVAYHQGASSVTGSSYAVAAGNVVNILISLLPITGGMREVVVYQDNAGQNISTKDYTGGSVIDPSMAFAVEVTETQASSSPTTGLVYLLDSYNRSG